MALTLFDTEAYFGDVSYDNDLPKAPLYRGLKVVITQNRDKENGVVNGQPATVLYRESACASIFLLHPKGYICCVYPVTVVEQNDNRRTVYPFTPAYSSTITKIHGQNMKKIILWVDCEKVPKGGAYVALSRIRKQPHLEFDSSSVVHESVQNCAARLVKRYPKFGHISPLLFELHWLPVEHRIVFKILLLVFKSLNNLAPSYISDLLTPYVYPQS